MDLEQYFDRQLDDHEAVVQATRDWLKESFVALCEAAQTTLGTGNKIMLFGNGGSAADAQHIAAELVVRYSANRAPLAAIALSTDSSTLTAGANDFGFETVFERQLRALGDPGDLAIGITTSGRSRNVVRALEAAREIGIVPAALSGCDGGDLVGLADPLLVVPSDVTARIQEIHILLGHALCDVLEQTCGR